MTTINYAFREISCKIVYYGAALCGKTTNLQYIHNSIPQKFRGELVSLATEQDRTLFFDFLSLDLGEVKGFNTKFQLYTVPGQVFYNATRKLVLRGVDGIVFVVDSQKERFKDNLDSLDNLKENLKEYEYDLNNLPWVIQYNKRDLFEINTIDELQSAINLSKVPHYESVATTGIGVKETLKGISSLILKKLSSETQETLQRKISPPVFIGEKKNIDEKAETLSQIKQTSQLEQKTPVSPNKSFSEIGASTSPQEKVFERQVIITSENKVLTEPAPGMEQIDKSEIDEIAVKSTGSIAIKSEIIQKGGSDEIISTIKVSVKQRCDVHWHSIKIGEGTLEFSNRLNIDYKGDYQITGIFRFLVFMRSFWTKLPKYIGKIEKIVEGRPTEFYLFNIELDAKNMYSPKVDIFLRAEKRDNVYMEYPGLWGKISIVPTGKKLMR